MQSTFSNALFEAARKHISLSATRQETLGWLAFLIMRQGSVCLWRLAACVSSAAQTNSVRRRFYRFFQYVKLDGAMAARVVVDLLGLAGKPWMLAIDRTNWDFGKTVPAKAGINILMISVMWKGMGIPLIWTLLPSAGNSNTQTRICLLDRLHAAFPDLKIASLLGDREFIGDKSMAYLKSREIPFILRLRENQHAARAGYAAWMVKDIARHLPRGGKMIVKGWCGLGDNAGPQSPAVRLVILRLPTGELLALACSGNPRGALARYRCRWTIESMFANLKTGGFNMEDTHITDPGKLSTLLAVLAIALALCVKTGVTAARLKPVPLKKHGRPAWSLCALGLSSLRKIFAAADLRQSIVFLKHLFSPKLPLIPLKFMTL